MGQQVTVKIKFTAPSPKDNSVAIFLSDNTQIHTKFYKRFQQRITQAIANNKPVTIHITDAYPDGKRYLRHIIG